MLHGRGERVQANTLSDSHSLNARKLRVSWSPRSVKLTSRSPAAASSRNSRWVEKIDSSRPTSRTSTQPASSGWNSHLWASRASESACSIPASSSRPPALRMAGAPKAPSTWNHSPSARHSAASAASGSTLPVLVVPEVATTQNGRHPAARSAATAAATSSGRSRYSASLPSRRTWDGCSPTSPAARPIQEWV